MELTEPDRPSPEIVSPDLYLTEEAIALAAVVDAMDLRVFGRRVTESEDT